MSNEPKKIPTLYWLPMSIAPRDPEITLIAEWGYRMIEIAWNPAGEYWRNLSADSDDWFSEEIRDNQLDGWIPMPVRLPKQKKEDRHD